MKFKTNKLSLKVVIASALLAASLPALAVTGDTEQPIHIESDTQSLDMQGNVVTFTGNVVVTRGHHQNQRRQSGRYPSGRRAGERDYRWLWQPGHLLPDAGQRQAGERPCLAYAL